MKKSIVIALLIFSCAIFTFANSGPIFWKGYPESDVMSIQKDSPIKVEKEDLVFDFSAEEGSDFTISGRVTAAYKMVNPTNKPQSVQMAFPFVGRLDNLAQRDISIAADDIAVPYSIYIGDVVDSHGNPMDEAKEASYDFESIVATITDKAYKAKSFTENDKGRLYTINVKPTTDQDINFEVVFNYDHQKTKVLIKGFNGYEREDQKTKLTAWCHELSTLEIYVLGEAIDFTTKAYTDGERSSKTDLFTSQISTQDLELKPYLMQYITRNSNTKLDNMISEAQLYNLYAKTLDRYFMQEMGYCSDHDLMAQDNYERIMTLVYTVEFPPAGEKRVSVSYKTSGTMDKRETAKPLYSFEYILNPAENWSDFKNLDIKIIPSHKAPYIVKSSIDFTRAENNVYTASLIELPKDDLSFTLYEDERITLLDKTKGRLNNSFGYFYPLVVGSVLVLFLIIGVVITKYIHR